jgi:hypothetical protein
MKYIKLFEGFKESKYEQIKPLPKKGGCNINNEEQLNAIINILEQRDYEDENSTETFMKPNHIASIGWSSEEDGWFAYGHKQHGNLYCLYQNDIVEEDGRLHDNLIFFHEYFKLKHKFRGHKLKKFGV